MPKLISAVALLLATVGILLVCEVIRPFRDLAVDGPIALACWGVGTLLATTCFFLKPRSLILTLVTLGANLIPLIAALALLWLMSRSNFGWH